MDKIPVPSKTEVIAKAVARMGRTTDNAIAHVTPGEMVVPNEVFQRNPALKNMLTQAFVSAGADPRRYIVGNKKHGRFNPKTGQQEFGFFEDILRFAAPVAADYFGFGDAFGIDGLGSALAAGAATKLTGGEWGEALGAGLGSQLGTMAYNWQNPTTTNAQGVEMTPADNTTLGINNSALYSGVGSYLGGKVASSDFLNPKMPTYAPLAMPAYGAGSNTNVPLPSNNNSNTNTAYNPDYIPPISTPAPEQAAGVKYLTKVKNRDTGEDEYTTTDDYEDNSRRSMYKWGSTITV